MHQKSWDFLEGSSRLEKKKYQPQTLFCQVWQRILCFDSCRWLWQSRQISAEKEWYLQDHCNSFRIFERNGRNTKRQCNGSVSTSLRGKRWMSCLKMSQRFLALLWTLRISLLILSESTDPSSWCGPTLLLIMPMHDASSPWYSEHALYQSASSRMLWPSKYIGSWLSFPVCNSKPEKDGPSIFLPASRSAWLL